MGSFNLDIMGIFTPLKLVNNINQDFFFLREWVSAYRWTQVFHFFSPTMLIDKNFGN